jgi:hypothetical protein
MLPIFFSGGGAPATARVHARQPCRVESRHVARGIRARARATVQRWIALFHSEMERTRADGSERGIPTILVKVEESCNAAARAVAKRPVTDRNSAGDPADRREKSPLQPRFGVFLVAVALRYVLSKSLMTRRRWCSSSLHSLNIEFGAARVAALPRAAWSSGCSWPSVSGATLSAAHAANLKPYRASWGRTRGRI